MPSAGLPGPATRLRELAHRQGERVIGVTHSQALAAGSDRLLVPRKGRVADSDPR
ncbi:hypothetical protein [Streptomyces antarcticus]|uniref:hypothetical protein n=1 Tax=Streptomyces antarcticus TaxID=2996458 RepID=UPI00226FAECF|nr:MULTISPECIES: hypothetical protein [unclassified Streptomyces]MCZ4083623.1 hypothetical protein [Streptomyces sp. H34-S5]